MAQDISLKLFNMRFEQLNEMHREHRRDTRALSDALVQVSRQIQNLDRRVSSLEQRLNDVKDELEGTIKMEIGGAIANLETRLEDYMDRRFAELRPGTPGMLGFSEE